ncbi:hypothetical protein DF215_16160 [Pectobacterium versatile]|nr:hypothetical protein DF215_16160 [Pectobacterium versatile]
MARKDNPPRWVFSLPIASQPVIGCFLILLVEGRDVRALKALALIFFISGCSQGLTSEKIEQDKKWNSMMEERNKKSLDIKREAGIQEERDAQRKLDEIRNAPRVKCEIPLTGSHPQFIPHISRAISIINKHKVTCKKGSELQIDGRPIPLDPNSIRAYLEMAIITCMSPYSGKVERNECTVSIDRGVVLWLRAVNDKRISDEVFTDTMSYYGSFIDFGEWALRAYYYKTYR